MPDHTSLSAEFMYRTQFGFDSIPPKPSREIVNSMAKIVFSIINGDGKITARERAWVKGYYASKGYAADVVDSIDTMEALPVEDIVALMAESILRFGANALLYDAIRAAHADRDYPYGEHATVNLVAAALGVSTKTVGLLEKLVEDEQAQLARRVALLFPLGHPNLCDRYRR
ncbi:MAG: hypothetical protein H0T89_16790 [Deltaproteobacteria bacterium]|nr:hypothetical protein [Deltaproteobacteria bacterium]MDQ3296124.1 hypothetical protein [Myxococcota bacterium]